MEIKERTSVFIKSWALYVHSLVLNHVLLSAFVERGDIRIV